MNVVILGAGEVGFNIAQKLAKEGNNVSVVDNDPERIQKVADSIDVKTVLGHASHPSTLAQADAGKADLLIAATFNDEVNMLACQVAHTLFKVPTKMARIRDPEYVNHSALFGKDDLPIDLIISPEKEAAKAIIKRIQLSSTVDAQDFAGGRVQLLGLRIPPKTAITGLCLRDLGEVMEGIKVYIVAREHNGIWHVPRGRDVLLAGDSIYAAMASDQVNRFLASIGLLVEQREKRHIMMVGGGHVGFNVAKALEEEAAVQLKIIELNKARAEWLSDHLNKVVVICGDALDRSLLVEENIEKVDDFLALTNDDETNILASLVAKNYAVPHVVTLINRAIYTDLVRQIGLDVTVSPRLTTISSIMRHIRKGRILGTASLGDGSLEVIEAEALETSDILGKPLRQLRLPPETAIGAVVRDGQVIIPNGDTIIQPHDHVLIVTAAASIPHVEKLFEVHLEFF